MQWKTTSELTPMVNQKTRTQWKSWQVFLGIIFHFSLGWQTLFKENFKTITYRHKSGNTFPKKKQFFVGFRLF